MNLSARISGWRKYLELTQQDLADACGITVSAVSLWESGDSNPSQKNLESVVKHFGITMERFYGRIPRPRRAS